MKTTASWLASLTIGAMLVGTPYVYYRHRYETHKRIRVVEEGKVYRSGTMTAEGMEEAVRRFGIRTVINLQEEAPDPALPVGWFGDSIRESKLLAGLGVRYEPLTVDILDSGDIGKKPNAVLAKFHAIMDDPASYPVLVHCRAGLHRTGCLVATYRMEYNGWSREQALRELKAHGFGYYVSSRGNPYIDQYIHRYEPRAARGKDRSVGPASASAQRPATVGGASPTVIATPTSRPRD